MQNAHEPNIAVMENRLKYVEETTHMLATVQLEQTRVNRSLELTISLMQADQKAYHENDKPKINQLWDNRSSMKGGWEVVNVLGACIVGAATVGGIAYEVFNHMVGTK